LAAIAEATNPNDIKNKNIFFMLLLYINLD